MKKNLLFKLLFILLMAALFVLPAYAQQAEPAKSAEPAKPSEPVKSGEPATAPELDLSGVKFSAGADFRLRQEIWPNTVFLGAGKPHEAPSRYDRNFFRLRISVWGKADMGNNFDAYAKITSEPKYQLGPYHPTIAGQGNTMVKQYFDQDEVIVDNLYVSGKKLFNGLVDFRLGRQDFLAPDDIYGEGFLIIDGTPVDGSRSWYFNAAKIRFNITKDNRVDLVYINDPSTDIFMPSIHPVITKNSGYYDNRRLLNISHEQGFVIYSRNNFNKIVTFDPYYIYKIEDPYSTTPRLNLHTFGGRVTFSYQGWRAKGELAYQFGEYDKTGRYQNGIDRTGLGGYGFVGYKFNDVPGKPEVDLGAVYYSGDNPNDDPSIKRTAFDPLFSRAPYWNELMAYTLIPETAGRYFAAPGYWNNMIIYMIKGKVDITKKTSLALSYQYLMSAEKTAGLDPSMFSNNSRDRGHMFTSMLNQKIMKNLTGMLQFEYFIPGEFYNPNTKNAIFFRWQLQYKI